MPSTSKKQAHLMAAVAHNPAFAKKVGIPQSVGKDFNAADKGRKFAAGGVNMINRDITRHGRVLGASKGVPAAELTKYIGKKEGGMAKSDSKEDMKMDKAQDKAMIKKAFSMHDKQEHKGEHTNLSKLKKGGMAMKKMAKGGSTGMGPRSMSKDVEAGSNKLTKFGESAVQKRGHTKGMEERSNKTLGVQSGAKGGKGVKNAAPIKMARGGGVEAKGKTKGKFIAMCGGGMKKSARGR